MVSVTQFDSSAIRRSTPFAERDDVLAWQRTIRLDPIERIEAHLPTYLLLRHLMHLFDRHVRVLAAKFNQHEPATGFQRADHCLRHLEGLIELVIDVHHDDRIHARRRQLRVIDRANQFTSQGDVEERWYNIKFNHKMGANATFSLWWQISDYDSKGNWGFWAPWGSNTAKGGLISTQVSVKFNS